jgi:Tol biopolymer transport system component
VVAGDRFRTIPLPESNEILEFAVSGDGGRLAAVLGHYQENAEHPDYGTARANGLWLLDIASGDWALLKDLDDAEWQPWIGAGMSWSPSGDRIAYYETYGGQRAGLTVIEVESRAAKVLHVQGQFPHAWSHDGRRLAYLYEANPSGAFEILGILGLDGRISETEVTVRGMGWATDGRLLIQRPDGLGVIDPDTMNETEVLAEAGEAVHVHLGFEGLDQWLRSPSGRYLAVATASDQYHASSLYILDTEQATARLFYNRAGFYPLAWLRE